MLIASAGKRIEIELNWWRLRFLKIGRIEVLRKRLDDDQRRFSCVLDRPDGYLEFHTWSHAYQASWPTTTNWAKRQDEWEAKAQAFRDSLGDGNDECTGHASER